MEVHPDEYVFNFNITNTNNEVPNNNHLYYEGIDSKDVFPLIVNYELLRIYYHNGKTRNACLPLSIVSWDHSSISILIPNSKF